MRVFVSEFLTSGAWTGPLAGSLLAEGRAMATAILTDAAAIPDVEVEVEVETTWDIRLADTPKGVNVARPNNSEHERELFGQLARQADLSFVIAPESDGLLTRRFEDVRSASGCWCGANESLLKIGADKFAFFKHLHAAGIPTIETQLWPGDAALESNSGYHVLKPRFGAGSQSMSRMDLSALQSVPPSDDDEFIVQPWVDGTPFSVGCVATESGVELLPPVEQKLNTDFTFSGGEIDLAATNGNMTDSLHALVRRALATFRDEWTGFIGFDLILPQDGRSPVIVELNPRLTTSYIGYRKLFPGLIESILFRRCLSSEMRATRICFCADGTIQSVS